MNLQSKKLQKAIALAVAGAAILLVGASAQQSQADNLTEVSVTLSNSRPSFHAVLAAGNTAGSSQLTIKTTGTAPSLATDQLAVGDELTINANTYDVTEILSVSTVSVSPVLDAGDVTEDEDVYGNQVTNITAEFSVASAVNNGNIEILVPSHATLGTDVVPDPGTFDTGGQAASEAITCPNDLSGYNFTSAADKTLTLVQIGSEYYHVFHCGYDGTGAVPTTMTMTLNNIINPSPPSGHTVGTADSYRVIVRNTDSTDTTVDSTATSIGLIEAVRVTATIAPQLTFQIIGIDAAETACGVTTHVDTTPISVPFGELSIDAFTNAAQNLKVSTNAAGGYVVTAKENNQLGKYAGGATCPGDSTTDSDCIQDSRGDTTTMTHLVEDEFNNVLSKGFAYSLENVTPNRAAFSYGDSTGGCVGAFCARQFADADDSQAPVPIFSSLAVADGENINVCYRIIPSVTTEAGDYINYVTYTATATF